MASGAFGAAVVAVALAGCGGGGGGNPVEEAAEASLASPGAQTTFSGTMRVPGASQLISWTGEGFFDNRTHRARVSVDLSSLAAASGGAFEPELFRGEEIVDAARSLVLYLRFPYFSQDNRAKPWIRIKVGEEIERQGFNVGSLALNQGNPGQYLAYLRATTGDVRKVGEEDVSGVRTTRYQARIDLHEYPDTVAEARRDQARLASNRLIQLSGAREIPTDVWIDDRGFVRQLTFFYSVAIPGDEQRIEYHTTLQYSGFGPQRTIELPPAREVTTIGLLPGS